MIKTRITPVKNPCYPSRLTNKIARMAWAMVKGNVTNNPQYLRGKPDRAVVRRDVRVGRTNST